MATEVFRTNMLGPDAVAKLNALWDTASQQAAGLAAISTDPGNIVVRGSDAGLYVSSADTLKRSAGSAIGGHRLVSLTTSEQVVCASADSSVFRHSVVGMTLNAASAGGDVDVKVSGIVTEPSWNWDMNSPVFLGLNGIPTQTIHPASVFGLVVGFPVSPTKLFVSIGTPIAIG